jgi:hypothetical protein
MGEEIELASKSVGEAAGAVAGALAERSGALEPAHELAKALTSSIHYRFYPRVIRQAIKAAERIEASGLPRQAFEALDDGLLRAILEGGATASDEDMHERWANLLANAVTSESPPIRRAFPSILSELEPRDALVLDQWASETSDERVFVDKFNTMAGERDAVLLNNLSRLELIEGVHSMPNTPGTVLLHPGTTLVGYSFTALGWAFIKACQAPRRADAS